MAPNKNASLPIEEEIVDEVENAESEAEEAEAQPQYITREEFQAGLTKLERTVQRIFDGSSAKLNKSVEAVMAEVDRVASQLKSQGVDLPADKINALKINAIQQAQQTQPQEQAQGKTPVTSVEAVNALAADMLRQAGMELTPADPEYRLVNTSAPDPYDFLTSLRKAIGAKQQRIQNPELSYASAPSTVTKPKGLPNTRQTAEQVAAELTTLLAHPRSESLGRIQELQKKLAQLTDSQ